MTAWRWVRSDLTDAIHDRQLAEHGGLDGVRDKGAVESVLARPQNLDVYAGADAAALAAAYAYGLAWDDGFADGNKRTAWVIARLFLAGNGFRLKLDPAGAVRAMEMVAAGALDEVAPAEWFQQRIAE
ncbi:type II toxin-antitoxin system death-on-curing family toxin [Trinickia acidisoli]|uniref:type II toxin-antitoxin system death-on-curing family toxin n=1 Tax=Trinickia acidisoli TaxID=2767482 RepID=UPI001A905D27|nr:type II toxin-antitoxin system death-on-curing family toxin [Trinickia acidisoli]